MKAFLIIIPHTLIPAVMGTDCSGDEGKGVSFKYYVKSLFRIIFLHGLKVGGNILVYGTALSAGSAKAGEERKLFFNMSFWKRLRPLSV